MSRWAGEQAGEQVDSGQVSRWAGMKVVCGGCGQAGGWTGT